MRRATVNALRSVKRSSHARRSLKSSGFLQVDRTGLHTIRQHHPFSTTSASSASPRRYADDAWRHFQRTNSRQLIQPVRILESAFLFRNLATFVAGLLVASGAYWALNGDEDKSNGSLASLKNPSKSTDSSLTSLGHTLLAPDRAAASGVASTSTTADDASPVAGAETTRRALVVENDQFFAGEIVGNEPLSKQTDASGRLVVEMLTPEQATEKLRRHEQSWLVGRGKGVVRYDVTQVASNNPIEDDHAEKVVEHNGADIPQASHAGKSDWMFWGVFDGHSGWTTSAKLRQVLISYVARELNSTYSSASTTTSTPGLPSPEAIETAIKRGFVRLDHEIVHESVNKLMKDGSRRAAAELLAPALSGSCALLSFYDTQSKILRVACTGDSRAVLGRRSDNGRWVATALSEDLTGGTPSEDARLRAEHPGEEFVTRNGRILGGLEPSRAFGDAVYKWSLETQKAIKTKWFGRSPSPLLKTPPYVTAEPVVTTTKIMPERGDFVVMATDGLWECLTNEEVVGLVGQWIDQKGGGKSASGGLFSSLFGGSKGGLPVENHAVAKGERTGNAVDGQRAPIRQLQWQIKDGDERFVVEDKNAATHLVRNALGGRDRDMFCALLTLPAPYSRRYRDDLTVEVIFFGDGEKGGDVVQNVEATAMDAGTKPKL